jgi:DNA polymerase elongation subunit (family B)
MYQNIYYQRSSNTVFIWDDVKGLIKMPYKKYAYKKNAYGSKVALDGTKVEKVTDWDEADIKRGWIYESDIRPEVRTLIDLYSDSDDISTGHREMFFDIEVETEGGFAQTDDPWQPLTSIAFHDVATKQTVAIIIDKEKNLKSYQKDSLILEVVETEQELILKFLQYYTELKPTILSGWNIDFFDVPYLYGRIHKVLGKEYANMLSPISEVTKSKNGRHVLHGVSCLDYMSLYKMFSANEEVSYALDSISKKELGRGKTEFEGDLKHLYKTDPAKYVEYNVYDVILVVELDEKLKFLSLARGICHKGHVPYEDIYFTTRYLDGACLTYLKRLDIVAPNRAYEEYVEPDLDDLEEETEDFEGAYVMDPILGRHEWGFDIDMKALYPTAIRTLNISPETQIGHIPVWDEIADTFINDLPSSTTILIEIKEGKNISMPVTDLRAWLVKHVYSISSSGVIYDLNKMGILSSILATWMQERDDFRAEVKKQNKLGNREAALFYDLRQQVTKRMNNSLYGALGAKGFRFYDLLNATSITLTGQAIIKHAISVGNKWFSTKLGKVKEYQLYADTDSAFYSAMPIINSIEASLVKKLSYGEKIDATYKTAIAVENSINETWDDFAKRNLNVDVHYLEIKQEYVFESAFWIAKKRYAQKIISEKGVSISDITNGEKTFLLDVKGLDVVRSSFPKEFRSFMSDVLIDILNFEDKTVIDSKITELRQSVKDKPILDIMSPTGVKEVTKWQTKRAKGEVFTKRLSKCPVHVKSALNFNDLLYYFKVNDKAAPIANAEKIKWVYLKDNPLNIKTCAVRGFGDPKEIVDFISQYIDYDRVFEAALEKKLTSFYKALNWGGIPKNSNVSDFFSFQ